MPVQIPVAYNPRTRLEDDIAFASDKLVLVNYTPKTPSQVDNVAKNGDSFTEVVAKIESKIKDLNNRTINIEGKSDLTAEQIIIKDYVAKTPSQIDNNIVAGDNVKEATRKIESRVIDLNDKINIILRDYSTSADTTTEMNSRIAEAIKDFITSTEINNRIENRVSKVAGEVIEQSHIHETIDEKITTAVKDIPSRNEIEETMNSLVDNRLANIPTNDDLREEINISLENYYNKPSIETKIDEKIINALTNIPDRSEVGTTINDKIKEIISSAPSSLDTLNELAEALNNDPNFATTMTNLIGTKLGKNETAVNALKVNNLTVETAVPANAKFTDTTYSVFKKSGAGAATGLVPAPPTTIGITKFLREDCSWSELPAADKVRVTSVTTGKKYIALSDGIDDQEVHTSDNFYVNCTDNKLYVPNIQSSGDITGNRVYNAVYGDYAELMPRGENTEPGDIIMLDLKDNDEKYIKAYENNNERIVVAGVHSDEFGMLIGGDKPVDGKNLLEYNIDKFIPVALSGRVHVKFIGKAEKGTEVVPSSEPGYGRIYIEGVDNPKTIIGYLVESDDRTDKRKLKIRITK